MINSSLFNYVDVIDRGADACWTRNEKCLLNATSKQQAFFIWIQSAMQTACIPARGTARFSFAAVPLRNDRIPQDR